MLMPEIKKCTVNDCFYWSDNQCRANAILVGDEEPFCDTYVKSAEHAGPADKGKVGACHVSNCEYNSRLSCSANGIEVGCQSGNPDCLTFEPR